MLFGEHAALFQKPCIVTAVNQRMKATVEFTNTSSFELQAPDVDITSYQKSISELGKGDIPKEARFVEMAVKNFVKKYPLKHGIKILTTSEFSSLFGFGSSSASTVCVIKALSELFNINLDNKQIFDLAYKTVIDIQKKGSGFDVAAAIYGGTLYFVTGGEIVKPLSVSELPIVVGYSGKKADTIAIINQVSRKTKVFIEIAKVVANAQEALEKKDWKQTGELMNKNQMFLKNLGVSTKKLDLMIAASLSRGAYGAKLSGAGGGDCMIALVDESKRRLVEKAIKNTGGQVIDVSVNAEGVRIES